jgi:hypothetical protein
MAFRLPPGVELAAFLALLGAIALVLVVGPPLGPLAAGVIVPSLTGLLTGFALLLGLDLVLSPRSAPRKRPSGGPRRS